MSISKVETTRELCEFIDAVFQKELEKEFDDMIKNLNERKGKILAGILLNVKKEIDIQTIGEKLIFTIREIKKEKVE
ncbi:MAG: hypothetical protein WC438_05500 [Candidatus Pacearchaeota archaeon]